jgi:ABC-2 type transport system ATP-binding protein
VVIEVSELTKRYGSAVAVDRVSFKINRGEIVGLLGPNGAGKTTTIRVLTTYLAPTSGTVSVAGFDVEKQSLEVRRRLGYLPESAPLYDDMRVSDYLEFSAEARGVPGDRRRGRIDYVIEHCGLKQVLNKTVAQLSKGYRQRVGLAQALVHDPEIIILDEPTSGLDPNQIVEIRNLIREIGREKTVVLSTHILQEVSATCNRIIIIHRGRIVADGTQENLRAEEDKQSVYHVCVGGEPAQVMIQLGSLQGVRKIEPADGDTLQGFHRFRVEADRREDLAQGLHRRVVDNGWPMTELSRDSVSLEDVFRKLTHDE